MASNPQQNNTHPTLATSTLSPLIKWPGGKGCELAQIRSVMPLFEGRYLEPFVGGGAVWLSLPKEVPALVNDIGRDLIDFYRAVGRGSPVFETTLDALYARWQLIQEFVELYSPEAVDRFGHLRQQRLGLEEWAKWIIQRLSEQEDLFAPLVSDRFDGAEREFFIGELKRSLLNKGERLLKLDSTKGPISAEDIEATIESALKGGLYTTARELYNRPAEYGVSRPAFLAFFWFVREYAYASMFRKNRSGHFNVPYGGISYNRKEWRGKVAAMRNPAMQQRLLSTSFSAIDFQKFLEKEKPSKEDFLFVDPPYDTTFSNYGGVSFGEQEHRRLAQWLIESCRARWLLVIQSTPLIDELYRSARSARDGALLQIAAVDKTYRWTIKERNQRRTELLFIANYPFDKKELSR